MIRSFILLVLFLIISHNINSQEYYNKNIFGFATSNTFTYFDVNGDEFKDKIDKISPKILRFPGGAVGNFYHFDGSAYGMKINEIDSLILGKFPKRARGLISYSKRKKHNKNYIHDFIDLAKYSKSTKNNINTSYKNNGYLIIHLRMTGYFNWFENKEFY